MSKKRIVHLISSLKIGGAESLLCDLIAGMHGFEHTVICFHKGPNVARMQALGVSVYHIQGLFCCYDPIFLWRLYRCIRTVCPDLIHSALWAANFLGRIMAWFLKIPIICVIHLGVELDGKLRNLLDRPTFSLADHVIAISQGVYQSLKTRPQWIAASKITLIPNGIDSQEIMVRARDARLTRASIGLSSDHILFGAVGRFIPRKNYGIIFESFAIIAPQFPLVRLILVGTGPLEYQLRKKAYDLGIAEKVVFVVDQPAYGYYPLFDCFVLASEREGLSIALLEALSCGIACIVAHPRGELHDVIITETTGLIVPPGDIRELAVALQRMIDPEMRNKLGKLGLDHVKKNFGIHTMIDAYSALFSQTTKI